LAIIKLFSKNAHFSRNQLLTISVYFWQIFTILLKNRKALVRAVKLLKKFARFWQISNFLLRKSPELEFNMKTGKSDKQWQTTGPASLASTTTDDDLNPKPYLTFGME
jgi:hypothetical protein